jgi:hypothetical protein
VISISIENYFFGVLSIVLLIILSVCYGIKNESLEETTETKEEIVEWLSHEEAK